MNCNPSARLEQEFEDRETEAAAEGSAAHALCEHKLRRAMKMQSRKPTSQYDCDEMDAYTDDYVQFVLDTLAEARANCADPQLMIEQRLDFSCYVPDGFGTGDCVIIADHTLHIIDFKYGQGVLVEAENNPQMMLYALGALAVYECLYDIDEVSMTIYQPRRENISTWTISVDALKKWAEEELRPRAELELINQPQREHVLWRLLTPIKDKYDYILIDCSPSLGLITVNALTAADSVIIPVQAEYFALEGISKLLNTIRIIKNSLNPDLEIEGFLLTMYDSRLRWRGMP